MDHPTLGHVDDRLIMEVSDDAPDFSNTACEKRIHDWRNYVGEKVAALWAQLPLDVRLAIMIDAQTMADKEDWD
jgi:hypothetical protein